MTDETARYYFFYPYLGALIGGTYEGTCNMQIQYAKTDGIAIVSAADEGTVIDETDSTITYEFKPTSEKKWKIDSIINSNDNILSITITDYDTVKKIVA